MTDPEPREPASQSQHPTTTNPGSFVGTPYAERYVIAADNLRRRQLESALLHGSSRTWREQRRIWLSVVAGVVVAALIVAAIAVLDAFRSEQELQRQREASRQPRVGVLTVAATGDLIGPRTTT